MKHALGLSLLLACTTPPARIDTAAKVIYDDDCPVSGCGTNTNLIDGVMFSSLHWSGKENEADTSIKGYGWLPTNTVRLDVWENRLVGLDATNKLSAEHARLVGSQIVLQHGASKMILEITAVHNALHYWAANDGTTVESYTFMWRYDWQPVSLLRDMCLTDEPVPGLTTLDAITFEGETYDAATKTIDFAPDADWFNIACLGSAPAKMHMMRHTGASGSKVVSTSRNERQAMLNMWTANYCGDGVSFTYPGQPLLMRDSKGWIPHAGPWSWIVPAQLSLGEEYEAIWDKTGAVCMNIPRLYDSDDEVLDQVVEHCASVGHPLPPCSNTMTTTFAPFGHILTANPVGS
jgi:hypothetical protein